MYVGEHCTFTLGQAGEHLGRSFGRRGPGDQASVMYDCLASVSSVGPSVKAIGCHCSEEEHGATAGPTTTVRLVFGTACRLSRAVLSGLAAHDEACMHLEQWLWMAVPNTPAYLPCGVASSRSGWVDD